MRLMASVPFGATSASKPSDSMVSLSMEARDSLSSTMRRRFMRGGEFRISNFEFRMKNSRTTFVIHYSKFEIRNSSQSPKYDRIRDNNDCSPSSTTSSINDAKWP